MHHTYIKNLTQDCFNRVQMYGKADGTKCKDKKISKIRDKPC